jgi:hypothetical protein
MHELNGVSLNCNEKSLTVHEVLDTTFEALNDWSQSRGIDLPEVEDTVKMFHAFLHGLVCLKMEQHMYSDEAGLWRLVRRGIHDLLASWSRSTKD